MYKKAIEYLPHEKPMVFLDDVIEVSKITCTCMVTTHKDGLMDPFLNADGSLDTLMAIEMMAQCTGVWSGYHCLQNKNELSMGMLVGISNVCVNIPSIKPNSTLHVHTSVLIEDGTFGSFECNVTDNDKVIISGIINTYKMDS